MRLAIAVVIALLTLPLQAAEFNVVGDQLIISGSYDDTALARVRDVIADQGAGIRTVVLRNLGSRGGNSVDNMLRIAELFAERRWRTAVSGSCTTACAFLFLGGVERHFTSDQPATQTYIILGGTTWLQDSRSNYTRHKGEAALKWNHIRSEWIKRQTGGRISDATLQRIFGIEDDMARRYLHFFDARRLKRKDGASVLLCTGKEVARSRWDECEKLLDTDAYRSGIVTSAELLRSNDRQINSRDDAENFVPRQ